MIRAGYQIYARILSAITTLKERLGELIEPDFGLLDELCELNVLSGRQCVEVRNERTVYERNDALLYMLTAEECHGFLEALRRTGQRHVVNFITQNGGQNFRNTRTDIVTYQSNVTRIFPGNQLHWYNIRHVFCAHVSALETTVLISFLFLLIPLFHRILCSLSSLETNLI